MTDQLIINDNDCLIINNFPSTYEGARIFHYCVLCFVIACSVFCQCLLSVSLMQTRIYTEHIDMFRLMDYIYEIEINNWKILILSL